MAIINHYSGALVKGARIFRKSEVG